MTGHRPYDEYKSVNISWLDKIPSSWTLSKLKYGLSEIGSGGTPDTSVSDNWANNETDGYPWIAIADMTGNSRITTTEKRITQKGFDEKRLTLWPEGTLLFSMYASLGTVSELGVASCTNQAILALVTGKDVSQAYLKWWLISIQPYLIEGASSNTQANLNAEKVKNLPLLKPSHAEQQNIVSFLDRETSKIDELIKKQERLIELIEEKITSVIDTFVTKGLDKSAPLKMTKFQTLGEVPSHWDVLQIKRIVSTPVTDGPHETPVFLDEGVPFISAEAISKGFINFDKIRGFISPELNELYSRKYSPKLHDIYMVKSGATTGVTAIVEDKTNFNIWSPLAVIRCSKRMNPYYVLHAMRSKYFQEMVSLSWSFGTQQNIGMGVIENLCLPVPTKEEQDAIVLKINSVLDDLKPLRDKAFSGILLLKEHRASLISAAVTGKIDVREMA